MRPVTFVLLGIAITAAVGAVVVANRVVQRRAAEAAHAQMVAIAEVEVLVAAHDVAQGRILRQTDLRWDRWPTSTATMTQVVIRNPSQNILDQLPGIAVRHSLVAGEPISAQALFTPGIGSGFMAGMVAPGKKAVGVTVTAASTASGFVLPGDLVDVILTVDLRKAEVAMPGGGRYAAEKILHAVRVLAVDQSLTPGAPASGNVKTRKKRPEGDKGGQGAAQAAETAAAPDEVAMVGKTVALEVTPEEAERLLAAQATGTLSLALRSLALSETDDRDLPFTADVDTSRALRSAVGGGVRVIKGGEVAK